MLVVLALRLSNASLSLLRPLRRVGWATTHDNIRFRAAFAAVMAAEARVEDLSDRLRPRRLRLRLRRDPGVKDGELIRVDANADGEALTRRGSASAFLC